MKCRKCGTENRTCASYCTNCRYKFTKKEQNNAKTKSLEGIILRIIEVKSKVTSIFDFSFITGKLWFKIASIILVLIVGILSCIQNGAHLKILKSDAYQINYNKKLNEYYLAVDQEETKLNLYIPYQGQDIVIKHMDLEKELKSENYQNGSNILLKNNEESDYYLIIGKRLDQKKETLKVYIYKKGEITNGK